MLALGIIMMVGGLICLIIGFSLQNSLESNLMGFLGGLVGESYDDGSMLFFVLAGILLLAGLICTVLSSRKGQAVPPAAPVVPPLTNTMQENPVPHFYDAPAPDIVMPAEPLPPPVPRFCSNCGASREQSPGKYCSNCGHPLQM